MKKLSLLLFALLLFSGAMLAQRSVSGTITDESGIPLIGANVIVKGTTTGTITDFDGTYSVTMPDDIDVLVISYAGYTTKEVDTEGQTIVNVTLAEGLQLDEIVVTGYGTKKKSEITGSTVNLGADRIESMPVATIDQVFQGQVPGLVFNSDSGTPGSTTDIRIRGVSSITAGNEPLFVIDGVPVINDNISSTSAGSSLSMLSSLNANNIESITVLKDASSTAQYGARGANGVIVITTKSGTKGKTKFDFSATYGVSNDATPGPTVLTAAEREELFYESVYNTFGETYGLENVEAAGEFARANTSYGAAYQRWIDAGRPEADWAEAITNKNAPMSQYNLSASGGTEDYTFFASGGYYGQEATVIGSDFERLNGQLNFSKSLTPNIRFNTNNTASYTYQDGLLENSAYFSSPRTAKFFMSPLDQPYDADGNLNTNLGLPNPLYIAQNNIDDSKFTRILTNNSITWDTPIPNLSYTGRANIDYQVYNYKNYWNPIEGDGEGSNGYAWQTYTNNRTLVIQNLVNYYLSLGTNHGIDLTALQEWQNNDRYYLSADGESFSDVGLTNLSSAGNPTSAFSTFTDWAIASYMASAKYSGFQGKYILDATFRREGNSRFSRDYRWGNFWSVGAAWNLHRESFLQNSRVISDLKLRFAYGISGNGSIGLNQYQALLNFDSDYNGEGASYPGSFGNEFLTWETNHSLDLGTDFGLFNNRINGSFSYYRRESKDLLLDVPLSLTTGFSDQTRNIGRMENKGIELELDFALVRSNDFNLTIGGNIATANNQVLELAKDLNGEEITITNVYQRVETGQPVYGWYMPTWAGVNPETGNEEWYINGVDGETTSNFNQAERVFQGGSAIPKLTSGMNFHVDYKGVFIDATGYYATGHKVYEAWHRYTQGTDLYPTALYQGLNTILDRWQQPGDETRFGKIEYTGRPWQRHSKFLYDGTYFRLKFVTVGYDFDPGLLNNVGISNLRLFARGTNLFTWVKDPYLLYDPEVDAGGETSLTTPPVKSMIVGLNIKF